MTITKEHGCTRFNDHGSWAVDKMTQALRKPRAEAVMRALVKPLDEIEGVLFKFFELMDPDAQTGHPLERIGKLVGVLREGMGDSEYRVRIKAKIRMGLSRGTVNDIIEVVQLLLADDPSQRIELREGDPGEFMLTLWGATPNGLAVAHVVDEMRLCGTYGQTRWMPAGPAGVFTLGGSAGQGFGAQLAHQYRG